MPTITLTQRVLAGGQVALSMWLLNGAFVITRLAQADYDKFAQTRRGAGDAPGRPDPAARFLMAMGGIETLNTVDGWPHFGDIWEVNDPDIGRRVYVATGDRLDWGYQSYEAAPPTSGQSRITGITCESRGHIIVLDPATDFTGLTLETISLTPRGAARFGGLVTILGGVLTVDPTFIRETVEPIDRIIAGHASATFDAASSADSGAVLVTSLTMAHTIANQPNRYLAGQVGLRAGQDVSAVDYDGAGLTIEINVAPNAAHAVYAWKVAPPVGTANLVFTFNAATSCAGGGLSAYGVHQTTPHDETKFNFATSAATHIEFGPAVAELIFTQTVNNDGATVTNTPDAAWTVDWNRTGTGGNNRRSAGAHITAGAGVVNRDDTLSAAVAWTAVGASLIEAPAPAVGGGDDPMRLGVEQGVQVTSTPAVGGWIG